MIFITRLESKLSCRPKLKHLQAEVAENVKRMMSEKFHKPFTGFRGHVTSSSDHRFEKPPFVASCSSFGPKVLKLCFFWILYIKCQKFNPGSFWFQGIGLVVRIASRTTESVYKFLQTQLASLEPLIGVLPYRWHFSIVSFSDKFCNIILCLVSGDILVWTGTPAYLPMAWELRNKNVLESHCELYFQSPMEDYGWIS